MKGMTYQDIIIILNLCILNDSFKMCKVKIHSAKRDTNKSTILLGGFSSTLRTSDRPSRQKSNQDVDLNNILNRLDLITTCRILQPKIAGHVILYSISNIYYDWVYDKP